MGEISCVVIGTLPSSDLHYSLAVLSTLPDNPGDSRFWTVSPGLQIRVWNLPDNHPSFPFLVDSTFWQWNFKYFALFELFYCWHRTFPHKHQYAIVIEAIMWLVGSKPIRSNVTIPTTSFLRVFFFFFTNDVMCHALWCHLSSLPYQFSIFENMGGWQPCIGDLCFS